MRWVWGKAGNSICKAGLKSGLAMPGKAHNNKAGLKSSQEVNLQDEVWINRAHGETEVQT